MATLSVWKFNDPAGAERAVETLTSLQSQELIQLHDAAVVSWEAGKKKPKTNHLTNLAGAGALGGAFWGLLFGLLFFVPILGLLAGAAGGAIGGSLAHGGIDENFVNRVKERITPGTSALFALTSGAVVDKVAEAFKTADAELISTNLSSEEEAALRQAFVEEG